MSPWEARVVVETIHEVYFTEPGTAPLKSGQLRYDCHRATEGAGTRQVLVQSVRRMVGAFFLATTNLRAGQTIYSAVHKDEKSAYGKTITQSRLTPVVLDLLPRTLSPPSVCPDQTSILP